MMINLNSKTARHLLIRAHINSFLSDNLLPRILSRTANMVSLTFLLMSLVIPESFGSLYCEFRDSLCDWKSVTTCGLKLITNQSLDGDTGYLLADSNTCQHSQISQDLLNEEGPFKFRLKYLLRGPGPAGLSVVAGYTMSDDQLLWSTNNTDNSSWSYQDIVAYRGMIDVLDSIMIMAHVSGSSTVAIGSISKIEPFEGTTGFHEVDNFTLIFTTTDSNIMSSSTQGHVEPNMPRISLYLIGAGLVLIVSIILSVSIFCFVRK